ncbi:hypothetical protein V1290_004020 [Bradyrhizobium sp. AZCC 1578]|uniref:hypothetical protein n=1 Tax=unclassified Bradyrhizobium TaxID=2631580 RepID=UPI002FF403F8
MSTRIVTAAAFTLILASPAFADCNQELKALEPNIIAAGTGASETGMPGTKHQEEVLAGKQKSAEPETTGSTAAAVQPTSPHQEQVTSKSSTQKSAEHANQLMAEARKMSEAGDEPGCMKKAAELKDVLGVK